MWLNVHKNTTCVQTYLDLLQLGHDGRDTYLQKKQQISYDRRESKVYISQEGTLPSIFLPEGTL